MGEIIQAYDHDEFDGFPIPTPANCYLWDEFSSGFPLPFFFVGSWLSVVHANFPPGNVTNGKKRTSERVFYLYFFNWKDWGVRVVRCCCRFS